MYLEAENYQRPGNEAMYLCMLTVACQQPQVMVSINMYCKHCLFYTKLYSNQKTVHTQLYTDKYTLSCCSLYFPFVGFAII